MNIIIREWLRAVGAEELPASVGGLVQYGALGTIAGLGLWFMWRAYRRECDRSDRLSTENKELNEAVIEKVMPVILASNKALEESTEMMRDQRRGWRFRDDTRDREGG